MDLASFWFLLVTILFTGFFLLEGYDFGVGMLMPFVGRTDKERQAVFASIGPYWDANEVWLITAGGAMFAAFPHWYATLFSGFYIALVLMLFALILRGVAFEFRNRLKDSHWRSFWTWTASISSFLVALLWGVAVGNFIIGMPIDADMNYVGSFFALLNWPGLVGGSAFVLLFLLHGATWLSFRSEGEIHKRAMRAAWLSWLPAVVAVVLFVSIAFLTPGRVWGSGPIDPLPFAALAAVALLAVGPLLRAGRDGLSFLATALTVALTTFCAFAGMYPNVMISSLDPEWSLTVYNASSSPYTLSVMSVIAIIFVPLVLLYTAWTYWIFRQRVGGARVVDY